MCCLHRLLTIVILHIAEKGILIHEQISQNNPRNFSQLVLLFMNNEKEEKQTWKLCLIC